MIAEETFAPTFRDEHPPAVNRRGAGALHKRLCENKACIKGQGASARKSLRGMPETARFCSKSCARQFSSKHKRVRGPNKPKTHAGREIGTIEVPARSYAPTSPNRTGILEAKQTAVIQCAHCGGLNIVEG